MSFLFIVGFDIRGLSIDAPDDVEGLDLAAAHVGKLLSAEQRGTGEGCSSVDGLDVEERPSPFFSFATLLRIVKRLIVKRFRSQLAFVRSVRSAQSVCGA